MICPSCKKGVLEPEELEPGLIALACPACEGHWLQAYRYWAWLKLLNRAPDATPVGSEELKVVDSSRIKICPGCSHLLVLWKVGHGYNFNLDRCGACGGIWFDRNEWYTLKKGGFHDDIHFIFGLPWQRKISPSKRDKVLEEHIRTELSEDDLNKLENLFEWLEPHPEKRAIISYIMHSFG